MIGIVYTGRWWVDCYMWYSEEGPGRPAAPPMQVPLRCAKCNRPPVNCQCTNFILFDVALWEVKVLIANCCHTYWWMVLRTRTELYVSMTMWVRDMCRKYTSTASQITADTFWQLLLITQPLVHTEITLGMFQHAAIAADAGEMYCTYLHVRITLIKIHRPCAQERERVFIYL